ncbi:MAG: Hpt domain-containing protein [Chitinophagaceae bacterium]
MYSFQFDKSIDSEYLSAMYENDYKYIEQIFNIALSTFSDEITTADEKLLSEDIEGIRRAIHKIKSSVGFIGMVELQENCQRLEEKCSVARSFNEVKPDLENLLKRISVHKNILKNEAARLKRFNSLAL